MNERIIDNVIVFICFCIGLAFHILIFNHYFSLQEGWWETYAYLVNKGQKINDDFYLAWTPLFVFVNALYQKIFGVDFLAFSIIGVVAAFVQALVLYLLLREYFGKISSATCVIFASFLWFNSGVYIAKDYHTFVFILEFTTLLFFVKFIKQNNKIYEILAIFVLILLFFMKQNIGLCLFVSIFISYMFLAENMQNYIKKISFFTTFSFFIFVVLNFIMPMSLDTIIANDSKGDIWTMATRFILNPGNKKILSIGSIIFAICVICLYLKVWLKDILDKISQNFSDLSLSMKIFMIFIFYAFVLYFATYLIGSGKLMMSWFISLAIGIVLFTIFLYFIRSSKIYKDEKYIFIAISLAAISYSGTLADAFTVNANLICIAFSLAFIMENSTKIIKNLIVLIIFLLTYVIFNVTLQMPYYWNYNYQRDVFGATSQSKYPQMKGMYMDEKIANIYNFFYDYVRENSKISNDFYFFNFPIMYLLNEKIPPYRLVTHWLDVTSSFEIEKEFKNFVNDPKPYVVLYQYQTDFFVLHRIFQNKSHFKQVDFHKTMNQWVKDSKYKLAKAFVVPNAHTYSENSKNHVLKNFVVILQNSDFYGMKKEKFQAWLIEHKIELADIRRDVNKEEQTMQNGDILILNGTIADLENILPSLGVMPVEMTFFNTINVYEKIENEYKN